MSITLTEQTILPVRRDKQVSTSFAYIGGGSSVGGGVAGSIGGFGGEHNDLGGLQGGSEASNSAMENEYYHLNESDYINVGNLGTMAYETAIEYAKLESPVFTTKITTPLIYGSADANGDITIEGTSHATKTSSYVLLQPSGGNVGIGNTAPTNVFEVKVVSGTGASVLEGIAINDGGVVNKMQLFMGVNTAGTYSWIQSALTGAANRLLVLQPDGSNVGIGFTSPLSKLSINGGLHVGGESDAGDNNIFVDGITQQTNFTTGFQGSNWQINAAGEAEFGSLLIRGSLKVYELIINQLHYQNGGLIIGAGAGRIKTVDVPTVGSEWVYFEDPEGNSIVPFTVGAIVMIQKVDIDRSTAIKKIVRFVAAIDPDDRIHLMTAAGAPVDVGTVEVGDEVCTIGHTSNTAMQNSIFMSATDSENPFLRVLAGVSSYDKWSLADKTTVKLQLGNLKSLESYDIVPADPGYGLYSDNVYLKGTIVSTSGSIGGWTITNAALYKDGESSALGSAGMSPDDFPFYAGAEWDDRASADFRVTPEGDMTALGVVEIGTRVGYDPESAYTNSVAIKGGDVYEGSRNDNNGALYFNLKGYQGGTTKYRSTYIGDGKNSYLLQAVGEDSLVSIMKAFSFVPLTFTSDRILTTIANSVYIMDTAASGNLFLILPNTAETDSQFGGGKSATTPFLIVINANDTYTLEVTMDDSGGEVDSNFYYSGSFSKSVIVYPRGMLYMTYYDGDWYVIESLV